MLSKKGIGKQQYNEDRGNAQTVSTDYTDWLREKGGINDWVRSSLTAYYFGPSRAHDALFDVSLPRFIISNAALGLFASQLHFLGYVIDSLGPILFLIKTVTRRSEVKLVRRGRLCFYFFGGLNAPCLWHACGLPSGGFFRLRILHGGP